MATDIVMPNMGFDTQAARLIEWLKAPGDQVQKGELIAVIESDKANVELESVAAGVMLAQLAAPGDEVEVGAVIARIGRTDEATQTPAILADAESNAVFAATAVEVTPIARKLAAENHIDLAQVQGSGPRGRIMKEDVEAAIAGVGAEAASAHTRVGGAGLTQSAQSRA